MKVKSSEYLFKELGYNLIRKDEDYIIYEKQIDKNLSRIILFCEQQRSVTVTYGEFVKQTPSINMEEFVVIERQLKELGWLKHEENYKI